MVCWNCSKILSSSSAAMPTTAQPQTPGRSSMALERTKVRLQSRAYTRPASMQASYRVVKLAEVGTATAFHNPPEMPIRCVCESELPSPGLSNSGSRLAVLHAQVVMLAREQSQSPGQGQSVSGRKYERTLTAAPPLRRREGWRGPCRPGRLNGDISGRALGSRNKPRFRSSPARNGPWFSPHP